MIKEKGRDHQPEFFRLPSDSRLPPERVDPKEIGEVRRIVESEAKPKLEKIDLGKARNDTAREDWRGVKFLRTTSRDGKLVVEEVDPRGTIEVIRLVTPKSAWEGKKDECREKVWRRPSTGFVKSGRSKKLALELLLPLGWYSIERIIEKSSTFIYTTFPSRRATLMRYMRYYEQGLVRRRKIRGREHEYKLSRRGIRRLRYLSFNLVMQLPRPTPDDDDKIRKLKKELIEMEIDDYESLEPSLKEALIEESFPEDEKRWI